MNEKEKENFISEHIGTNELYKYLTGDYGYRFCLYRDGKTGLEQKGSMQIDPEEREISSIDCVGLSNLDNESYFTDGFCIYDSDTDEYIVYETGERIDLDEVIRRCCDDGDVTAYLDRFRKNLLENWEE